MDDLRASIAAAGLREIQAMNLLSEARIISDLCVTLDDIATEDRGRARRFLQRQQPQQNQNTQWTSSRSK